MEKIGKSTITITRMNCPNCGKYGELKLRYRSGHLYAYVDHYTNGKYYKSGNYAYGCYLGRFA